MGSRSGLEDACGSSSRKLKKEGLDVGSEKEWSGTDCGGVRRAEGEDAREVVLEGELVGFVKSSVWKKSLISLE
jgi:hypothetical protein